MKIIFAGTPETAVPCLEELAKSNEITAVLTRPDAPVGRGKRVMPSPVKAKALEMGLPIYESTDDLLKAIQAGEIQAELGAIVAYGEILRENVLNALPKGWVNLHYSLLPKYRGAAPAQQAILNGDKLTGVSVFQLTKGLDDGPIFRQEKFAIDKTLTSGELLSKLTMLGKTVLSEVVADIEKGIDKSVSQNEVLATYAPKLSKQEAKIDWTLSAEEIVNKINGFSPNPGAYFELALPEKPAQRVVVLKAQMPSVENANGKSCVLSGVELLEVKPAGKNAMPANAWLNGLRLSAEELANALN